MTSYTKILFLILLPALILILYSPHHTKAAQSGDLVKTPDISAVYYLEAGKRYSFPNHKTYQTWFSDFTSVQTISLTELSSYPLSGNLCYRANSRLVKIQTDPQVYVVEPNCILRHITSEVLARDLYGPNWSDLVDDVPDVFFTNYTVGLPITSNSVEDFSGITDLQTGLAKSTSQPTNSSDQQTTNNTNQDELIMTEDTASPTDQVVASGQNSVTVGELLATVQVEAMDITKITLTINSINGGGSDEIETIYLYDGSTQVSSITPTSNSVEFNLEPGIRVAANDSKKITIKVDVGRVETGFPPQSGQGFSLSMDSDDFEAKGVISGTTLSSPQKQGTFTSAKFIVHKSKPTITSLPLSSNILINSSGVPLYKFKIEAHPKGDIGFYKASFLISESSATVSQYKFYEDPDNAKLDLTTDGARTPEERIGTSDVLNILVDTNGNGTALGGEYRAISAGLSKTFQLEANISGAASGSVLSVSLMGDKNFPDTSPETAVNIDADTYDNFIWSDLHLNRSLTATASVQWFNSHLVFSTTTANVLSR